MYTAATFLLPTIYWRDSASFTTRLWKLANAANVTPL